MSSHTCSLTFTLTTEWWHDSREHTLSLPCLQAYLFCIALSGGCGKREETKSHSQTMCKVNIKLFSCCSTAEWENVAGFKLSNCRAFYIINLKEQVTSKLSVMFWMSLSEPIRLSETDLRFLWDPISDSNTVFSRLSNIWYAVKESHKLDCRVWRPKVIKMK